MKRTSFFIVSLFIIFFVCLIFLVTTESGLGLIQKGVNRLAGGVMSIGQVQGRLLGDGTLTHIRFVSADLNVDVDRIEYSWRPKSLLKAELNIAKVVVDGVGIALKDSSEKVSTDGTIELPEVLLPFAVLLESLEVSKVRIIDTDGQELFMVDRLVASIEGNDKRLTVNKFDLQSPEIGLKLHGNIQIDSNWTMDMQGTWRLAGFEFHPMAGSLATTGPLLHPHLELGVQSPADIRIGADFVNLIENPQWTAKLKAKDVDLSNLIVDCPKIELASVEGDLAGDFENYRGRVVADGTWETLQGMHLVSELAGDHLGIDFQSLRIDSQDSSAEAMGGKISWQDIFSWNGRFLFKNFDPSVIDTELQGQLTAELVSAGDVKEDGVVASFEILHLDGLLHDHNVSAVGNVFLTETEVYTDGLNIRSGEVAGQAYIEKGSFSWAEEPSWSAKIRLDQFDPSWLYSEFPGSINGEFEGNGKLGENGLEGSLDIRKISGTLRGEKLSGGGKITFLDDTLQTTGLVLKSGLSELVVNGHAGGSLALDFSLTSPDIGSILPQGKGSILIRGSLQGKRIEPQLDAKIEGTAIRYGENSFDRVDGKIHADLKSDGRLSGSIRGEKISINGFFIDKGAVKINGTLAQHQIVVGGSGAIGTLGFKALGTYKNEWQGELADFQLDAADYGVWRQEKKAAVTIGKSAVLFEKFCLAEETSSVCLGGQLQLGKDVEWTVQGELNSLPLKWLNRLKLIDIPVSGEIQASVAAKGDSSRVLSAKAEVSVSTAEVLVDARSTEMESLSIDDSLLTMVLADGRLQTDFTIQIKNGGQVVLAAEVVNFGDFNVSPNSLPLKGNLELKEFDLAVLSPFTGYGVEPTGKVSNSFTLAGTLGQPRISGELSIPDGNIYLPYQGITLENLVLSIDAGGESAQVNGKATSGEGQVTVVGTIRYGTRGVEGALNIQGSDFLLLNLPEYVIKVNPDLQLTFSKDKSELKGTIDIPYALITPEEMSDSISASEDVIIVSGSKEERVNGWPFDLDINVRLGDDVSIDGYGLTGKMGGRLRVYTTPDNSIAGRGELDLKGGTFTLYSRSLNIKRGRVLFTGGPIDNPGVDVRAQVSVSDQEAMGEGYTVGVDISGFVQDLKYHLFSNPYMDDTEIISFMIVGHSLANSSEEEGNMLQSAAVMLGTAGSAEYGKELGNLLFIDDLHLEGSSTTESMSVVVGKRLTDKLYIGYDLNMFSQLGQFRVRYDLTRGFAVETRSSAESTGTDLIYSFER
jgi:translocation and assembly module TamB